MLITISVWGFIVGHTVSHSKQVGLDVKISHRVVNKSAQSKNWALYGWVRVSVGLKGSHNIDAQWLMDQKAHHSNLPEQLPVTIAVKHTNTRKSPMSWTASCPDMINTYWLKKLPAHHECLAALMNELLMDGTQSEWFIDGQPQDWYPSNFQLIICLWTTWMPPQKRNTKGITQLLINRAVTWHCKARQTNLCSAWIN